MPGNLDGIESLKKYSAGLYSDFEYEPDVTDSTLKIDKGLLFLMAFWSGPAVIGFQRVCGGLKDLDLPRGFRFSVLDIDGAANVIPELSKHEVVIGGNAEGYWFRDGQIIAATAVHTSTTERIEEIVLKIGK